MGSATAGPHAADARIRQVLCLIESGDLTNLNVASLACVVDLSESCFRHLFLSETGVPLRTFLREARLSKALKLLSNRALSVKEVASDVGYRWTPNFVRAFKQRFGKRPSELRKALANAPSR